MRRRDSRIYLRVSTDLKERAKAHAEANGTNLSTLVVDLLIQLLSDEEINTGKDEAEQI